MTNKELIVKIKQLYQIQPRNEWREGLKQELLSQVQSFGVELERDRFGIDLYRLIQNYTFRPVFITGLILVIFFSGSVITVSAAKNSLPGQFLYPIKIVTEKARVTFARKGENKVKLGVEFTKERLEELGQIAQKEPKKTEEAVKNFQNNLDSVKISLQKLGEDDKILEDKIIRVAEVIEDKAIEVKNKIEKVEKEIEDPTTKQLLAEAKEYLTKKNFVMALMNDSGIMNQESGKTEEAEPTEAVVTQTAAEEEGIRNQESPKDKPTEQARIMKEREFIHTEALEDEKEEILEEPKVEADFKGDLLMEPEKGVFGGLLKSINN